MRDTLWTAEGLELGEQRRMQGGQHSSHPSSLEPDSLGGPSLIIFKEKVEGKRKRIRAGTS